MVAARESNFLEGGTVDPFSGLAPALTPEEEEAQRRARLLNSEQRTTAINERPGGYRDQRSMSDRLSTFSNNYDEVIRRYEYSLPGPDGVPVTREQYDAAKARKKASREAMNTPGYKALTYGILAAPAAITGAGAAIGGGGAIGGSGVAGSVGQPAGIPAAGTPFTMASPFAAGGGASAAGAGGAAAAGGAGAAAGAGAAGSSGGAAGFFNSVGKPVLGALLPLAIHQATGGRTDEEKKLLKAQEQMAIEAQRRQGQQQDARMNMLAQQVLAFNPRNQMLSQMFGPQAAFTPEQMATMVQGQPPPADPAILNYTGTDQAILRKKAELIRRRNEYAAAEEARRNMVMGNFQAPGAGPAPIQMPAPQAARRY